MKKKLLSLLLAAAMAAGMLPLSAVSAFADGGTPAAPADLAAAMNTLSGTYSGAAKWVDAYGAHEVLVWITLSGDEFSTETVTDDGEEQRAVKTIRDHSGSRRWKTTTFNGSGAPVYDEEPIVTDANATIDGFLTTPIAFTPFEIDAPVCSGGNVKIPAGSFSMDYFAFYDVQNQKAQKMYWENERLELIRTETGPFTLRELIGQVGGTYSDAETFIIGQGKISTSATYLLNEYECRSESMVVSSDGSLSGNKESCNAEGTTVWDVIGVDALGKPIYGEPSLHPDDTIEALLDCVGAVNRYPVVLEAESVIGIESVLIPAGSYYFEPLNSYFYGMKNGTTQNLYTAGTVLCRVENPVHEHTFSDQWSCNELVHWHASVCGHTEFVSGFGTHTFGAGVTAGNKTTYTCSACGYQKFVFNTESDNEGEIIGEISYTGISLTLLSDIYIDFYMKLTDEARQNGTMTFDIGGRTVTVAGTKAQYDADIQSYCFRTPLTVLEMNEVVTATYSYHGLDYVQQYSAAKYIEGLVGQQDKFGPKAVALAKKIANYGHYAQRYLASIHPSVTIGDGGYAEMQKYDDADIDAARAEEALENYVFQVSGATDKLTFDGSTVYFDSATALNYYVTVKNGAELTAAATNVATGEAKDVKITHYQNNTWIISVKDIIATELADDIAVMINGETTVTGSVLAYCHSVVQAHSFVGASEQDRLAVNAMAAMEEYYEAAMEYISFELCFAIPGHYRVLTADGGAEIQKEDAIKCCRSFSFRLEPDENYKITTVYSEGDLVPDADGVYTVSFAGGSHEIVVFAEIETVSLIVTVEGEEGPDLPNTKITFEYGPDFVSAQAYTFGQYRFQSIPKGVQGTIVITKDGYQEYRQSFIGDGTVEEISVTLLPNGD